jgi:hypothetical protein
MASQQHFPFVQFELAQSLGPPAGRYLVAPERREDDVLDELGLGGARAASTDSSTGPDGEPAMGSGDVLVLKVRGAQVSTIKLRKPKPKKVQPDDDLGELSVSVATVIFGTRMLDDERHGQAFLKAIQASASEREGLVGEALRILNRSISAYRACAADPYVVELTRSDPRVVRVGHGTNEQVVVGAWAEAVTAPEPPAPRQERTVRLMPQQAVAATLAGRSSTLEGEELLLRGLVDLEQGRPRAAAYQLSAAWDLLQAELAVATAGARARAQQEVATEAARDLRDLAAAARRGPLDEQQVVALEDIAEQIGATVDLWRYEPLGFA